jgi:hypothetical protein
MSGITCGFWLESAPVRELLVVSLSPESQLGAEDE